MTDPNKSFVIKKGLSRMPKVSVYLVCSYCSATAVITESSWNVANGPMGNNLKCPHCGSVGTYYREG